MAETEPTITPVPFKIVIAANLRQEEQFDFPRVLFEPLN
jgi:hypothetical protein